MKNLIYPPGTMLVSYPANGVMPYSFTVAANEVWNIISLRFIIITKATAGNRIITLVIYAEDGITPIGRFFLGIVNASLTRNFSVGRGLFSLYTVLTTEMHGMLPRLTLSAGQILSITDAAVIDATDSCNSPRIVYRRILRAGQK